MDGGKVAIKHYLDVSGKITFLSLVLGVLNIASESAWGVATTGILSWRGTCNSVSPFLESSAPLLHEDATAKIAIINERLVFFISVFLINTCNLCSGVYRVANTL